MTLVAHEPTQAPDAATARRVVSVMEYGTTSVPIELLTRDGKFDFHADPAMFELRFRGKEVVVRASHYVGQIAVNDRLVLDVKPRVAIERLDRILRLAGHVPIEAARLERGYSLTAEPLPALLDVIARAFLKALRPMHQDGLYRRYEVREEDTAFPRGRFLLGSTILRHKARGRARATVSYFEHTPNNGPNRALKLALRQLAALVNDRGPSKGWMLLVSELNRADQLFSRVDLDMSRAFRADPEYADPHRMPDSRSYYVPALQLAKYVVEGKSVVFDRAGSDVVLPSLLIDLQDAFEAYLRAALRRLIEPNTPGLTVLDGNQQRPAGGAKPLFDTRPSVDAQPDIVIAQAGHAQPVVLGEVKYINRNFSRDELNQAIAYGASYRAPCILIKPRMQSEPPGLASHGLVAGIKIYRYAYDLAADLEDQERKLARAILSFVDGTSDETATEAA